MHDTLVDFVKVLRTADIKVSPAETLDAMETLDLVGFDDRRFLKNSLALVLSKNPEEKEAFETCFEKFFTFEKMRTLNEDEADNDAGAADDGEFDDGDFDSEGNPSGQSSGKGGGEGGQGQRSGSGRRQMDPELMKRFDKNGNGKIDEDERPAMIEHFRSQRSKQGGS